MQFTKIDINNWTRKEYFDHYVLFLLHTKISKNVLNLLKQSCQPLTLTIVATNELHDFNHVLGCNYEKDLHL